MIKICFTVASLQTLKELTILREDPYYGLLSDKNLLHRCLIGKKIVIKSVNVEFIKWR